MEKEQILPIHNEQGELIAFYIYDRQTRQTVMYSCQLMGFEDIKNMWDSVSRAVDCKKQDNE